jgi:hypothetical protein
VQNLEQKARSGKLPPINLMNYFDQVKGQTALPGGCRFFRALPLALFCRCGMHMELCGILWSLFAQSGA